MGTNFLNSTTSSNELEEQQQKNRTLLVEFCEAENMKIMNTYFQKPQKNKCTFKYWGAEDGPPWDQSKYTEIDWFLVSNRGKNAVKDIGAEPTANIGSDHFPVICKWKIILKAQQKHNDKPGKYIAPTT